MRQQTGKIREFDFTKQEQDDEYLDAIHDLTDSVNALNALMLGWMVRS